MTDGARIVHPEGEDAVDIEVLAVPRASRSRVVGPHGDRLKVQLAAPPVDGAANAALQELLARELGVPRRDVAVTRGQGSRRKTVRVSGTSVASVMARLGLSAALLCGACSPFETEVSLTVLLPTDQTDLERTDNVSVQLEPGGTATQAVDGLDFELLLKLDPGAEPQKVGVFLADGKDLLAYGWSARARLAGAGDLSVFVGPAGDLAGFPGVSGISPEGTLAAHATDRGLVVVEPDGVTWFMSDLTLITQSAATLALADGDAASPDVGLAGDALGGIIRVQWGDAVRADRFDPGDNQWIALDLQQSALLEGRNGASHLADASGENLLVFGGGDTFVNILAVPLVPDEAGELVVAPVAGTVLDAPRRGAAASWMTRSGTDEGETVVLFGSDDPTLPVAFLTAVAMPLGPASPWEGGRCVQLDVGDAAGAGDTVRMLCAGGVRAGAPTADGVLITLPPDPAMASAEVRPGILVSPMDRPVWLEDDGAVYAHGAGELMGLERGDPDLAFAAVSSGFARDAGGASVTLPMGATFVLGGRTSGGSEVGTWDVFTPALSPD